MLCVRIRTRLVVIEKTTDTARYLDMDHPGPAPIKHKPALPSLRLHIQSRIVATGLR